jgi:hypothetical protein
MLFLAAVASAAILAGLPTSEKPDKPERPAEKIAGRWRIELHDLPSEHEDILASFAIDGNLLIGTFTVGRRTIPISSGTVAGTEFKLSFRHVSGETMLMRGRAGPRGLDGTWQAGHEKGKWSAERLQT